MAVYGIGCTYDDIDVSENFLSNEQVCIGWEEKEMEYFQGLFREIQNGDIIILKSFDIRKRKLIIKAIGIVKDNEIYESEIASTKSFCIKMNWIIVYNSRPKEIKLNGDGCTQRGTTIYKESNKKIIKEILQFIDNSIKR